MAELVPMKLDITSSENIAETLARELKVPEVLYDDQAGHQEFALPPGWKRESIDNDKLRTQPRRKIARLSLTETDSFIAYVTNHSADSHTTLWCAVDYLAGLLDFVAIINDHGSSQLEAHWRDHRASYKPEKSEEWKRWSQKNKNNFSQTEFAVFLEDNLKDIIGGTDLPSGAQMLEMALGFEARQDMRFKSALRLQSGSVRLEYISDEDKNTVDAMSLFERFQIAIPVFRSDVARYPITARLRYRVKDGKLVFWYELIRADLIVEQAARAIVEQIVDATALPFYYGNPDA
jgi:uncharacterized protein YfdQ (DUF2303 family)